MDFFNDLKTSHHGLLIGSIFLNILLIIGVSVLTYKYLNFTCVCNDLANDVALECEETQKEEVKEEEVAEAKDIYVEVKGAVKNPGVYLVKENNIINDVITKAGGFNKDAYTDNINLSYHLSNELVIYVYTKSEFKKEEPKTSTQECVCPTYDITACEDKHESIITPEEKEETKEEVKEPTKEDLKENGDTEEKEEGSTLVNINTASLSELMTLTGIGESKAQDIINYREKNGPFKSIEDIKKVNGIKDATFSKIKDYITV